jgi:hypothetical protein
LRFRIDMTPSGACSLASTPKGPVLPFESLAAALASARITAADAAADIEIWMDQFYVFVTSAARVAALHNSLSGAVHAA